MTTADAEAPASPPPARTRPRRRWPTVLTGLVALGLVAASIAGMVIRVPYTIISPGDATPLDGDVVTVSGAQTYEHRGRVLFLTVRISSDDPTLWRYLLAQLEDDVTVERRTNVIGCSTYEESDRLNRTLMEESQDVAKAVALRRLGYPVTTESPRAVIVSVDCAGPAFGELMLGDEVLAVDGVAVSRAEEIRPLVQARRPGDAVRLQLRRGDTTVERTVRAGRREGGAYLGIASRTVSDERLPFEVRIDTQRVSGPSAGLAFALAIVDDLTPGDLTGGARVAVTGSIAAGGQVLPVGGVAQKAVAARQAGARLMLVPRGEAAEARAHAGGMKVVAVGDLDDALEALRDAGGRGVPPSTPTSTTATG